MTEWTLERMTGFLLRAGVNPDGHGERIGETREEHVARTLREWHARVDALEAERAQINVLDYVPVQDLVREAI